MKTYNFPCQFLKDLTQKQVITWTPLLIIGRTSGDTTSGDTFKIRSSPIGYQEPKRGQVPMRVDKFLCNKSRQVQQISIWSPPSESPAGEDFAHI